MKDYVRLYRVGHILLMPTSVNKSIERLFILDSGAFATTISPETGRQVTKVHSDDRLQIHGVSGAVKQAYTADDVTLNFGGIQQPGRDVVAFDTSSVKKSIGLEIFRIHRRDDARPTRHSYRLPRWAGEVRLRSKTRIPTSAVMVSWAAHRYAPREHRVRGSRCRFP
jgi:hypothetical protein